MMATQGISATSFLQEFINADEKIYRNSSF